MYTTGSTAPDPRVDPVAYIQAKWDAFMNLFPRILDLQHRAAVLAATTAPGTYEHDTARASVEALARLAQIHTATVKKIEEYGSYIGLAGLGAIPVAAAVAFSALALVVVWVFRQYEAQQSILDMIEAGTLTPEQAAAVADATGPEPPTDVLGAIGGLGKVGALVLVALALALFARRWHPNPDLFVFRSNPPEPGVWSHRVYDLRYRHDDDGLDYVHEFKPGVEMQGLPDGSVRLFHPSRRLWREF